MSGRLTAHGIGPNSAVVWLGFDGDREGHGSAPQAASEAATDAVYRELLELGYMPLDEPGPTVVERERLGTSVVAAGVVYGDGMHRIKVYDTRRRLVLAATPRMAFDEQDQSFRTLPEPTPNTLRAVGDLIWEMERHIESGRWVLGDIGLDELAAIDPGNGRIAEFGRRIGAGMERARGGPGTPTASDGRTIDRQSVASLRSQRSAARLGAALMDSLRSGSPVPVGPNAAAFTAGAELIARAEPRLSTPVAQDIVTGTRRELVGSERRSTTTPRAEERQLLEVKLGAPAEPIDAENIVLAPPPVVSAVPRDTAGVNRQARRSAAMLRACYALALANDPIAEGSVHVRFSVDASGRAHDASVVSGTLGDGATGTWVLDVNDCVCGTVGTWRFARGAREETFYYIAVFEPE